MNLTKIPSASTYEKEREEIVKALNSLSSRVHTLEGSIQKKE